MSEKGKRSYSSYLKNIRGCPFPDIAGFTEENVIGAMDYVPRDDDIVMCSYPKTGTTWMQYIVWKILHKDEPIPDFNNLAYIASPFIEMAGVDAIEKLQAPRFYKHHLSYDQMKVNPRAKFIYVYRNPSDTLVSFYHFVSSLMNTVFDFNDFFECFMIGNVAYGDYFDHVLSFYGHRDDDNLLLVTYEDLHEDIRGQILRIAKFLGEDYYNQLFEDNCSLDNIVKETSFDYMKKTLSFRLPEENQQPRVINFFRKGVIGDGKSKLTAEQAERLRTRAADKIAGTELLSKWC